MEAIIIKLPILYQSALDAKTQSEGLGVLAEATDVTVLRDANQIPTLTMSYPKEGKFANQIDHDMALVEDMGFKPEQKAQIFRITNITKSQDGISVTAHHIIGDLANIRITQQVTAANCTPTQAWNALQAAFVYQIPDITFYSDVFKVANINWEVSDDPVTSFLLGDDQAGDTPTNTMQSLYGMDFYFDNYKISALSNKAHDTGKVIKWHQNMSNFTLDESMDEYYDGIYPYAKYTPNEVPEGEEPESQKFDGVGDVQYVGIGGAPTYDSPFKGHTQIGTLRNGSYYHVKATQSTNTVNDDTWYQLDNGQWIDEHFFTFDKSKAFIVNKITNAQGTIAIPDDSSDSEGLAVSYRGVGTITYAGRGKVAVWNSPYSGHSLTGKYLANGSRWKVFQVVNLANNHKWYNLGGDQWVDGQYLSIQKTTDYVATPTHGILAIKKKPVSYTGPGMEKQTNWNPRVGSKWRVSQWATGPDDSTLYKVSTYIWVKGDDDTVDFTSTGTVAINQDNDRAAIARNTGRIPIYSQPNGTHVTEHWVKVGEQYQIFSQSENNGRTWYEIGEGQWVDASYFNFDGDTDVAPGDDDKDSDSEGVEVEEQTVTLPEKYIIANSAVHHENPKIKVVDLSEYNIRDVDKLREVAQAWMKEYRIGIMPLSMTIGYEQMNDKYKFLTSVDLYDIIGIQVDELGIVQKAKVSSVTWNALLQRYTSITIGQLPVDYDHSLSQYVRNENTKTKTNVTKKATHLFSRMQEISNINKKNTGDKIAALTKLADDLNISYRSQKGSLDKYKGILDKYGITLDQATKNWDKLDSNIKNELLTQNQTLDALDRRVNEINSTVTNSQNLIESINGVFEAWPNWQNPQKIYVKNPDGSAAVFTGNGLLFKGTDGVERSGMDIEGNITGEQITGGTINGITLSGVTITGTSYINSYGGRYTSVLSTSDGVSVSSMDGTRGALSSSQLSLTNTYSGNQEYLTGHMIGNLKMLLSRNGYSTD